MRPLQCGGYADHRARARCDGRLLGAGLPERPGRGLHGAHGGDRRLAERLRGLPHRPDPSRLRTQRGSPGGDRTAIIPANGCVDLIVRSKQVRLCGPQTRVIRAPGDDVHPTIGLRLEAGTARRILPITLNELRDRVVELRAALESEAAVLTT